MKIILIISVFVICFVFVSCSSSVTESSSKFTKGKYDYFLTDSIGVKILAGTMNVDSVKSKFMGTYEVTKTTNVDYPGVSTLSGQYQGGYNSTSKMYGFNMNPKVADANVFISAKWIDGKLRGTWTYSTMMGTKGRGNFEAVKQK